MQLALVDAQSTEQLAKLNPCNFPQATNTRERQRKHSSACQAFVYLTPKGTTSKVATCSQPKGNVESPKKKSKNSLLHPLKTRRRARRHGARLRVPKDRRPRNHRVFFIRPRTTGNQLYQLGKSPNQPSGNPPAQKKRRRKKKRPSPRHQTTCSQRPKNHSGARLGLSSSACSHEGAAVAVPA